MQQTLAKRCEPKASTLSALATRDKDCDAKRSHREHAAKQAAMHSKKPRLPRLEDCENNRGSAGVPTISR
jgi:hypothetical protein